MRKVILVLIIAVAAVGLLLPLRHYSRHRLQIRTYFQDAQGLRAGAPVRVAGVEVGTVKSVRARPDLPKNPAEVVMDLATDYDLKVPADAVVSLETPGVLGETFADIDVRDASGVPITDKGVLKSRPPSDSTGQQLLERLIDVLAKRPCQPAAPTLNNRDGKLGAAGNALVRP